MYILILDTPCPLKLLFPEVCCVFFTDFCFADRFKDGLDSSLTFFSADEEDVRVSSYCRFSSELLLSADKLDLSPEILSWNLEDSWNASVR